jgi:integrase
MADVERVEDATAGTWLGVIVRLAIDTGARRGELLALKWSDLNLKTGRLIISRAICQKNNGEIFEKATKTRSTRVVSLSPSTLAFLEMHRAEQQQIAALFGSTYRRDLNLIFADPGGNYIKPQSVSNAMRRHTKALGLTRVGIHSMRHSHASLLLSDGVPVAVVSKRLGHSSPATTSRIYAHALPSEELAAAERWEEIRRKKEAGAAAPQAPNSAEDTASKTKPGRPH